MTEPESMGRRETALDATMRTLPLPALSLFMALVKKCGDDVSIDSEDVTLVVNKRLQYGCSRGTIRLKVVDE